MVTRNHRKRACAVVMIKHVKNPIKLAREMLIRGETDGTGGGNGGGDGDPAGGSGGAQGHLCLGGETVETLAEEWGLEMVEEKYFWTKKRWEEHRRGLGEDGDESKVVGEHYEETGGRGEEPRWDGHEYLPQGTVGCVALDQYGTICVATSTGGLTNKLSGRIGDTPTIGAGFWAEEWDESPLERSTRQVSRLDAAPTHFPAVNALASNISGALEDCLPSISGYLPLPLSLDYKAPIEKPSPGSNIRAVALGGTGNGDSFLKLAAARTAGAIVRFSPERSLASAVNQIAGPGGELQQSAGDRWGETGEGEGGMIGIELVDRKGEVVFDFNCGGLFRCWVDERGVERVMVFRDEY